MEINVFFQIFILVFSVMIHEISHGLMALAWGDKTAQYEGRLTLNPLRHIDWFGSVILPLILFVSQAGFMLGWAKPVPYNPYNLRNRKVAEPMVAFAGPLSNLIVAIFFGLIIRGLVYFGVYSNLITIFSFVILLNVSLAVFNLIPIPPLDGSKIISAFLPVGKRFAFSNFAGRYGIIIIIAIVFLLPDFITPIITKIFSLIVGIK